MVDQAMTYLPELKASSAKNSAGKTRWLELVETLRDITEGKIYLELQRARLTKLLASHHEELSLTAPETAPAGTQGEHIIACPFSYDHLTRHPICANAAVASTSTGLTATDKDKPKPAPVTAKDHRDAAADLMSDIQVETYSSMDKREKTDL
jgi:26S proteasome regulatory subunit N5